MDEQGISDSAGVHYPLIVQRASWVQADTRPVMPVSRKKLTVVSVVLDVVVYIILSTLVALASFNKLGLRPFRRGFFCNDETISYPYHSDTVPDVVVILISLVAPVVLMLVLEAIHLIGTKSTCKTYVIVLYQTIGPFLVGQLVNGILTEATKLFAGRLRPHFLAVCDPDLSQLSCAGGYVHISDGMCRGDNSNRIIEARKSFPSGHASVSVYGLLYLAIYLHVRFTWKKASRLFVPLLQCVLACVAIFCSISRVSDNKHHATDVIGGAILGVVVCLLVIKYFSLLLRHMPRGKSLELLSQPVKIATKPSYDVTDNRHVVLEMDNKRH